MRAILALATLLLAAPALAGDGSGLVLPADPGLRFEFKERTAGGVTVEEKSNLTLRFDGCWTSSTTLENMTDDPRALSITVFFRDEDGTPLDAVTVVRGDDVAPLTRTTVERTNCSPALAASFKLQRCWTVHRVVRTH